MKYPINEMQHLINTELPGYGAVIWTILIGLAIGLVYGLLIKRILVPALGDARRAQQWRHRFEIIEKLYLPVLGLVVLASLVVSHPLVGIVVSTIIVLLVYKPVKNYILGVIYRAGKTYSVGQLIVVQGQNGSIRCFNTMTLEVELEDGSLLDIPYDLFSSAVVIRSSPKSGVLSHSFELAIQKPCDLVQVKETIHRRLLSMPYVLPNQKIAIEHVSDEETRYVVKVIVHGLDKQQMYSVEAKLKEVIS